MNWKQKTLLALLGVTALAGVAASASAEDWDRGNNNGYYGQYDRDNHDRNSAWYYRTHHRDHDGDQHYRAYGSYGSYGNNGYYGNGSRYYGSDRGYYNGYGYSQQNRDYRRTYGERRDRDDDDD